MEKIKGDFCKSLVEQFIEIPLTLFVSFSEFSSYKVCKGIRKPATEKCKKNQENSVSLNI